MMRNLSDELISIALGAAKAGTYPTDGRFYYVASVDDDGSSEPEVGRDWPPDYLTLTDAVDRANENQRMAETSGIARRFVVRARASGTIVYQAIPQTGCECQRYGKSGVPWPSGKCMVCGGRCDMNGRISR